jgi:hypothetical protein
MSLYIFINILINTFNAATGDLVQPPSRWRLGEFARHCVEFCKYLANLNDAIAQHLGFVASEACECVQTQNKQLVKQNLMLLEETYDKILEFGIDIGKVHIQMQTSALNDDESDDEESDDEESEELKYLKLLINLVKESKDKMKVELLVVRKAVQELTNNSAAAAEKI